MCRSDPQIALAVTLIMASADSWIFGSSTSSTLTVRWRRQTTAFTAGSRVEGSRSVAVVLRHAGGYFCRGTPGSTRYAGGRAGKAATVTVIVGTSGWQYRDWRGRFYPPRLPQRLWLEHYAAHFDTVEVNNAFYRLPERRVFEAWRSRTPPQFVVTTKASRFLSHVKRLREPAEPAARLMDRVAGLAEKSGPVLLQLPPSLPADPALLDECLSCFPPGTRVAVEPRHDSWWTPEVAGVLVQHGAALSWADRDHRAITPLWRTADWGYLRLHHGHAPWPRYDWGCLTYWAGLIAETFTNAEDVFVYFNNDPGCSAVDDAITFAEAVRQTGHWVTRVPEGRPAWGADDTVWAAAAS